MGVFRKILFVGRGELEDAHALKQAMIMARENNASLSIVILSHELPSEIRSFRNRYDAFLKECTEKTIGAARGMLKFSKADMPVSVEIEYSGLPATALIRRVIRNSVDLVFKEPEKKDGDEGFAAMDMELLRKCPCPVWLSRPVENRKNKVQVAVAIDPEIDRPEGQAFSRQLLMFSRWVADVYSKNLFVVSYWDFEAEDHLRHNPWVEVKESELRRIAREIESSHSLAMQNLLEETGGTENVQLWLGKGRPEHAIPQFVAEIGVDIMIMGTVARTGVAGFIIGNTAENVIQKLGCSLIALKPKGFVSPVEA